MPLSQSQCYFGNALVHFSAGGPHSAVPVWLDLFAEAGGHAYAMSGSYGFLRGVADADTTASQWSFDGVTPAWEAETTDISDAAFDTILITPADHIQDQSPDTPCAGDTRAPLDAVLDIVGVLTTAQPGARILVYEGWADMAPFSGAVPPDARAEAAYHAYNPGEYHDWYTDLLARVNAADPDAQMGLLPVAPILWGC